MLRFAKGMKSIRSVFLNLVELGPGTKQIGPVSGYISTHQRDALHVQLRIPTTKLIKKLKLTKIGKGQSDPQENGVI